MAVAPIFNAASPCASSHAHGPMVASGHDIAAPPYIPSAVRGCLPFLFTAVVGISRLKPSLAEGDQWLLTTLPLLNACHDGYSCWKQRFSPMLCLSVLWADGIMGLPLHAVYCRLILCMCESWCCCTVQWLHRDVHVVPTASTTIVKVDPWCCGFVT